MSTPAKSPASAGDSFDAWPIGHYPPAKIKWAPVELVYCFMQFKDPVDPDTLYFDTPGRRAPATSEADVQKFIKDRMLDNSPSFESPYDDINPDGKNTSIVVEKQCFVVIEIDPSVDWAFDDKYAVTQAKWHRTNGYDDDNFGLGRPFDRFAYFAVASRSRAPSRGVMTVQKLNFALRPKTTPTIGQPVIIDPDTKNQNDVPPPPPPPPS
jgi:hypothetical protein